MTGQAGAHFVFEINKDDDRIYQKLNLKDVKRYLDRRILRGIPVAVLLLLVAVLLAAFAYDLLPFSAVLSAEGGFLVAYLAAVFAARAAKSRFGETVFRDIPPANRHIDCAFDDDAVVVKSGLRESECRGTRFATSRTRHRW
jgi:hypothetical protein